MRDVLLEELPHISVDGGVAVGVRNGRPLSPDLVSQGFPDGPFCVIDREGRMLAVYSHAGGKARSEVVFP